MHIAIVICPAIISLLGLLDLFHPWKASWYEWDWRRFLLGCWLIIHCAAFGVTFYFWRWESSHLAFQLMLEFSWLYALGIQVSFQWEIPPLFKRKVAIVAATTASACQISGFVVSHFHDYKRRGEDLVFFGSLIFHGATALAITRIYESDRTRTLLSIFLGVVFIATALSPLPIKLWANGDWFFLAGCCVEFLLVFILVVVRVVAPIRRAAHSGEGSTTALRSRGDIESASSVHSVLDATERITSSNSPPKLGEE